MTRVAGSPLSSRERAMLEALHASNRGKHPHVGQVPWNAGRKVGTTPASRVQLDRLHRSMRGRPKSPEHCANLRRPDSETSYKAIHQRLAHTLERACAHCGAAGCLLDAALIHGPHVGLRCAVKSAPHGPGLVYATAPEAYMRLCRPCHKRYDLEGGQ